MRKQLIAGNWKMNCNVDDSRNLITSIISKLKGVEFSGDIVVFPPFVSLTEASKITKGSEVKLGAQNVYFEKSGAFTGEISCEMLKYVGCEYVIIGHSERRTLFCETDEDVNKKVKVVLEYGLSPIVCVGETASQRECNLTNEIIASQVKKAFEGVEDYKKVVVAYEPLWAIGTGAAAIPEDAQSVAADIRSTLSGIFGEEALDIVPILYGGSVKGANIKSFMDQEDIDGALVGGASIRAYEFMEIINAVS